MVLYNSWVTLSAVLEKVEFAGTGALTLSGSEANFGSVTVSNSHSSGVTAPGDWTLENDLIINSGKVNSKEVHPLLIVLVET